MDTLRLISNGAVRIEINDLPLLAHCAAAVRHHGRESIAQAQSYLDVNLSGIDLRDHFYGTSDHTWAPLDDEDDREDPMLLGCNCGIDHCSPVTANITVTDETVVWSEFRSGMNWDSTLVGPFVFERQQYDMAIESAKLPGL